MFQPDELDIITFAEGVSDNITKQHFLPRNLVFEERKQSTIDVNDAPEYESTYNVKRCEGINISRTSRVLNNGKLANVSIGADHNITVQTAHLNKDGDLNEDGVWKFKQHDKENLVNVIFSSELTFCIVIVFNIQNVLQTAFSGIQSKLKLSIVSFSEPSDEDYNKSYLHKDLCTVNYKEPSAYLRASFSAHNNNLAIMTYQSEDQISLDIFNVKLQYHEKRMKNKKVYDIQKLKSVCLSMTVDEDTTLIFSQLADKIIIFNFYLEYVYVYEIGNDYDDQCEKFEGSSPNIIYDGTLKSEFLFMCRRKVQDIDIYQITKIQNSERRNLSSAYNLLTSLNLRDLIDKEISCNSNQIFVHSNLETLMYITDANKVYIFHPFKRQLICTLLTERFLIKRIMPVTWSGKETSFVYINSSDKYTLKVFSIEESSKDLSLQYLSRMAVLKTYSINMLKKMDIGKALLNILGSYET